MPGQIDVRVSWENVCSNGVQWAKVAINPQRQWLTLRHQHQPFLCSSHFANECLEPIPGPIDSRASRKWRGRLWSVAILGDAHSAPSVWGLLSWRCRCHDDSFCWLLERRSLSVTKLTPVIIREKETGEARTDTHHHHPLQVAHWQEWTPLNRALITLANWKYFTRKIIQRCKIMRHFIWKVHQKDNALVMFSRHQSSSWERRGGWSVELNFQWSQYLNRATPNIWSYLEFQNNISNSKHGSPW